MDTQILKLLKEIQENQVSLHDDMAAMVDRIASLEKSLEEHSRINPEVSAAVIDDQYRFARRIVVEAEKCSTSFLQRVLRLGYSDAARIVDLLEENGVVGPQVGSRPRSILIDNDALTKIEDEEENGPVPTGDTDDLYDEAVEAVHQAGKASTAYLQRKLRIGYSRAARLMDLLEENGVIAPQDGSKPREVLPQGE